MTWRHWVVAATLLAVSGCGSTEGGPPTPGVLTISVVGQGTAPGAMVLTILGGPIQKVTPAAGVQSALSTNAEGSHLLLVGTLATGEVAVLTIPDRQLAARYIIRVDQVADATTFGLLDPSQRTATLTLRP